ncbi:hypothetical protein KIPB_005206 [Kipferlia bialata]|uniref:Uncharacterized protein n=1 Tax=Kipferlia bialata TaxID=797122 RepID=A0A391NRA8_9EUKA|nr:hypothetical protein KIPB_005206 [Kipferlia bialata]|eukprot:g5206.t1
MPTGTSLGVGMVVKAADVRAPSTKERAVGCCDGEILRADANEAGLQRTDWLSEWKCVGDVATVKRYTAQCKKLVEGDLILFDGMFASLARVLDAAPDFLREIEALTHSQATNTVEKVGHVTSLIDTIK